MVIKTEAGSGMLKNRIKISGKVKKILLILILVLIIAGVAFGVWRMKNRKQAVPLTQDQIAQDVSGIIEKGDFNSCDSVQDNDYKIICKNNIAQKLAYQSLDTNWCLKLDDQRVKIADCISSLIPGKAIKANDVSICNEAGSLGYENLIEKCINNFWVNKATSEGKAEYCDNIKTEDAKDSCTIQVTKYNFFKNPDQFSCKELEALNIDQKNCMDYKNTKNCGSIQDMGSQMICKIAVKK